jgi:hypothetical protein
MRNSDMRRVRSIMAADRALGAHRSDDPRVALAGKRLAAAAAQLAMAVGEVNSSRDTGGPGRDAILKRREALRMEHMLKFSRMGKAFATFMPINERALAVPHARATSETLADAADRMARGLRPHVRHFRKEGFPKDFLERMLVAAKELRVMSAHTAAVASRKKAADAAFATALSAARREIVVLDALLYDELREHVAFASAWKAAIRVGKRRGRRKKTGTAVSG